MSLRILLTLTTLLSNCQSRENTFVLEGRWQDTSCLNSVENCKSRYPVILIKSEITDSLDVMDHNGEWKKIWTNSKWQSYSIKLENSYESLLFPSYETNSLQYYDDVKKEFVYYKKLPNK
ncbi:MAG: hypothetical protein Q8K92_15635 [Leadbetterella sp.]|jgi:hypothetical protein|nr:hypothetical protein [Leadbetterella sp.]